MARYVTLIGLIAILTIFSGCRTTMPEVERNWGKSFEAAKQNQTLNPGASRNTHPVVGLDGKAAESSVRKYEKSFGEGPSKQTYNLNLGNISGIGQK